MSVTIEEFLVINDYEWVVPQDKMNHNHMHGLIETMFRPKDGKLDLQYCLLEVVTFANKTKIGSIYIYSNDPDKVREKQRDAYKRVIQEAHLEKKGLAKPGAREFNPTRYNDYYAISGSYQHYGTGNQKYEAKNLDFHWWPDAESGQEPVSNEAPDEMFMDELDPNVFCEYLKHEAEQLMAQALPLKKYPYHAIIIKPVAVRDRTNYTVYPLGNFFLYFGTMEQKSPEFYNELISRLLLVWLHEAGSKLIEEIQQKAVNESVGKRKDYIPDFSQTRVKGLEENIPNTSVKREVLFTSIYESPIKKELLKGKWDHLIGELVPFILYKLDYLKPGFDAPPTLEHLDTRLLRVSELKEVYAIMSDPANFDEWLLSLHTSRMAILLMHIAFGLSIPVIHTFLRSKNQYEKTLNGIGKPETKEDKHAREFSKGAMLVYFSRYFIYPFKGNCSVNDSFQERLYTMASPSEQQYLRNQCLTCIRRVVDPAKIDAYDKRAYSDLRLTWEIAK